MLVPADIMARHCERWYYFETHAYGVRKYIGKCFTTEYAIRQQFGPQCAIDIEGNTVRVLSRPK